jgi:lipoprotein-releasing system permease protein
VALLSSLAAGYMPARKAARVHPVDIIRGAT